jgi:CBS domain-containing protein
MSIKKDARHAKRQILEQLTALRDEAKLQLHLLSLDARKRWSELDGEIDALEARADREGEKATEALRETAHALTRTVSEFVTSQLNHSSGLMTNVHTLMTPTVRACAPQDTLSRAAQIMWESNYGALPVVSTEGVVAMLTDRDVCMAAYTQGKPPCDLHVATAMSKELFSCAPDDSIGDALAKMANNRVRRLPVVDSERRLVGVITLADVARWPERFGNPSVAGAVTDTLAAITAPSPRALSSAAE